MSYTVRFATRNDIPAMIPVINAAFRVEAHIVDGGRTDSEDMEEHFDEGLFLLAISPEGAIAGSIYMELRGERAYFGMLAVDPARQGAGLARLLIDAAEEHARKAGCGHMDIYVLSARTELPSLYRRLGYSQIGARTPHPEWAHRLKIPCYLIQMSKPL